jgi:hypothetical protein
VRFGIVAAFTTLLTALSASAVAQTADDRREWPRTDFSRTTVAWTEIVSGGPPKDGIPAIDRPRHASIKDARAWLKDREPVIALRIDKEARAYPLQILMYHEIVNDVLAGTPVTVTFCPLCNAAIAFDRRFDGQTLDFGTTGRVRLSDLVMYDRQTESWWQQFGGEAIVGRLAGGRLKQIPAQIVAFSEFVQAHPAGSVLSRETGFQRPYGRNPYVGYDRIDQPPFLFRGRIDERLPPMERVLSVSVGKRPILYPLSVLRNARVVNGAVDDIPYVVFVGNGMASALDSERIEAGSETPSAVAFSRRLSETTLSFSYRGGAWYDKPTGTRWNLFGEAVDGPLAGKRLAPISGGVHFAFAWLAFNPDSEIVRKLSP